MTMTMKLATLISLYFGGIGFFHASGAVDQTITAGQTNPGSTTASNQTMPAGQINPNSTTAADQTMPVGQTNPDSTTAADQTMPAGQTNPDRTTVADQTIPDSTTAAGGAMPVDESTTLSAKTTMKKRTTPDPTTEMFFTTFTTPELIEEIIESTTIPVVPTERPIKVKDLTWDSEFIFVIITATIGVISLCTGCFCVICSMVKVPRKLRKILPITIEMDIKETNVEAVTT